MLNHLKILNSQKLSCLVDLLGLKTLYKLVSLTQLEEVTDCLSSVLFCIIVLFFMAGSSKNIQKTSICSNKNTQEELNNFKKILRWKHISFSPLPTPFLEGRITCQEIGKRRNDLRKSVGKPKWDRIFSFSFSQYYLSW